MYRNSSVSRSKPHMRIQSDPLPEESVSSASSKGLPLQNGDDEHQVGKSGFAQHSLRLLTGPQQVVQNEQAAAGTQNPCQFVQGGKVSSLPGAPSTAGVQ